MATRRADMFTADGKPSPGDPREHRIRFGDERTTLADFATRFVAAPSPRARRSPA